MTNPLQALRADHTNFKRLLTLLEDQIAAFRQGEEPDYELMRDALHYMTQYPDRVHHPVEDQVFERLLKLDASLKPVVTDMMVEHERVIASGSELLRMLEDVLGDAMMSRETVAETARRYVDTMRKHIDKEETTLFPLAEKQLKAADWSAVAARAEAHGDPLFGMQVNQRYRALLERLPAPAPRR